MIGPGRGWRAPLGAGFRAGGPPRDCRLRVQLSGEDPRNPDPPGCGSKWRWALGEVAPAGTESRGTDSYVHRSFNNAYLTVYTANMCSSLPPRLLHHQQVLHRLLPQGEPFFCVFLFFGFFLFFKGYCYSFASVLIKPSIFGRIGFRVPWIRRVVRVVVPMQVLG